MTVGTNSRQRVLAIAARFDLHHIPYLAALSDCQDLVVAANGEARPGVVARARGAGLRVHPVGALGLQRIALRLQALLLEHRPDAIHVLYSYHEEMAVLARQLAGDDVAIILETRDPLSLLLDVTRLRKDADPLRLEREALTAADGHIVVSGAMGVYLETTHDLDLSALSLVVPQCFSDRDIASPVRKYSADDGRVHIALDGTVSERPDHERYYVNIIRKLVASGFVVHSHFFDSEGNNNAVYRALGEEIDDYHFHEFIQAEGGTDYSHALSRYDLMGVFHELDAARQREADLLRVSLPMKAVSGWLLGGIPSVCFRHYRGVAEYVDQYGIGFVVEGWEDLAAVAADRRAIMRASEACKAHRDVFTAEANARRVADFTAEATRRRLTGSSAPGEAL